MKHEPPQSSQEHKLPDAKAIEGYDGRITVSPDVCGGRPCIKGTRLRVGDIVSMLAAGMTREEILADYSFIEAADIAASLAYAAQAVDHRVILAA